MKLSKATVYLIMLLMLSTLTLTHLPITVTATPTEIEVLTFFAEPHERLYWDQVIPKFQTDNPGITVKHTAMEFDALFDEIIRLHLIGQDPDIISVHGMWLPRFAEYRDPIVSAEVRSDVIADVVTNYLFAAVKGSSYKGVVYGYPTEIDSHALVYNKTRIPVPPKTWGELRTMALANTQRVSGEIYVTGFMPYINGNEEKRYEFMNLLWSNNGTFLDLTGELGEFGVPTALFNSDQGVQALQLFDDLNENNNPGAGTYDPDILPDIYWQGWVDNRITMVIIPTWFNYIRDALGARFFTDLGVAPIPIGPSMEAAGGTYPTNSTCVTFNHLFSVTQRAVNEGRAAAAWTFLKYINTPRPAGYIPTSAVGPIPRGGGCSILGDYFIFDGILPSRNNDRLNGLTKEGKHLSEDFWFKGFMDMMELYGKPDPTFIKSQEVQDKVGVMFERVASYGEDPETVADETAADVNLLLPAPGDINMNGRVYTEDGRLVLLDWDARPTGPTAWKWNRGRSDIIEDNWVSAKDGGLIVYNFGREGDP